MTHLPNNIDRTTITFSFFTLLIIVLFLYIFQIEKKMESYTNNNTDIIHLRLLDKELNNFSLTVNKLTNYDIINKKEQEFEAILKKLQQEITYNSGYNKDVAKLFTLIHQEYTKQLENLEHFKAYNASLINSSHFLFDTQKTISKSQTLSIKSKYMANELLFYLVKYASSDYIDNDIITQKLQELQNDAKKEHNSYLQNFYIQAKLMYETAQKLKEVSLAINTNLLHREIIKLQDLLSQNYKNDIYTQSLIALVVFTFTLMLLIFLIYSHLKSLKIKKELYAFRYAIEHSDNIVVITDENKKITYVNDAFEKATGYKAQEVLHQNPNVLKSDKHSQEFYQELNQKLENGEKWEGEFINKRKDGSLFYEKASIIPIYQNNQISAYLAIKLDITEYIEQNMKLAQAASVFENTEEAIIIADEEGRITSVNTAFSKIYGYTLEEIQGKNLRFLQSGQHTQDFYENMWHQIMNKGIWKGKIVNKTKDKKLLPIWATIKKVTDNQGRILNFTAIQTDLRELETSQAKANYLAYHDPLTTLYNRASFEEYLSHILSVAKRKQSIFALLFIDLDRFKIINDTLGHSVGDKVLVTVAKRLKSSLRESDFISRLGGDEFVIILENLSAPTDAAIVAQNIIHALTEPIEIDTHSLITTASIGISLFPENAEDADSLIKYADTAMYHAKDMGKNNFRFYTDELSEKIQRKLEIDLALQNALKYNEMYLLFQPQYCLDSKEILSLETLIRWENQKLGFVPPDKFIPIAEDSNTILEIGYFVFKESCKALKRLEEENIKLKHIAVNVSSKQFQDSQLLENFIAIANEYGVKPNKIEIEITERFMMEYTKENIELLQKFRDKGFKISIDDFGTGYSSMAYLQKLPVDTIKIDKSFVSNIGQDKSSNVIIEAIIALAKTLGYSIVAEGIETNQQELFLKNMQCNLGQGYLFSRPKPFDEILKLTTRS